MQLIRGLHNLRDEHRGCVATIGNFDGVHRGHQAILEQCRERAQGLGVPVTVVVFEPQPREYFSGDQAPPRLTRLRDKVALLAEHGADFVLCLPFNEKLRSLTAQQFIDRVLLDGLGVRHLVVGDDFRFGCDRSGDFALLARVGAEHGVGVEHTCTFALDDQRVSSSRVRTLLASGNFAQARHMMGRPYRLSGRVMSGQQLGRKIGVPTANLPLLRLPLTLRGVYAVVVELSDHRRLLGVANIGWRPTVGSDRPLLEVHLFDFAGDLYGDRLTVFPCARLRGEIAFDGIEALKAQIACDQSQARGYFAQHLEAISQRPIDGTGGGMAGDGIDSDFLPLASAPLAREAATSDTSVGRPAAGRDANGHS